MQIKRLCVNDHLCLVDFEINFNTINGGSSTILIGENGTGKSTMLETILEILMSFDSKAREKYLNYDYLLEYNYAQKDISISRVDRKYRIEIDGNVIEGKFDRINAILKDESIFPQRIITFYSGLNNRMLNNLSFENRFYKIHCRKTLKKYLKVINNEIEDWTPKIPQFPKKKYYYCDEKMVPLYLTAILDGTYSHEKEYLQRECHFNRIHSIDMRLDLNRVEWLFNKEYFVEDVPHDFYFIVDFLDYRFTDILRKGFLYSENGKGYFSFSGVDELEIDSISILNFYEVLQSLFNAEFRVSVAYGDAVTTCEAMSEGQRQLIKVLGMLGVCKTEDCLVLMDEPDAHMNPKWKYEIEQTIAKSLQDAVNTQAIIATHDPLVINGVSKEFIRIFTHDKVVMGNKIRSFTKVITPTEETEGLGIDGLLQSEYYGLPSVLDSETKRKMDEKHSLLVKKKDGTITDAETQTLLDLTVDLENMSFARNIPTDSYYDEYVAAMHKIYSERPEVKLTKEDITERNAKAEEILRGLLEK